ncbi:unnamed protein product [Rotaria sordida]|uniref:HAT C-terminal dimerisation domain-containing protein n=1 Tax=Rotaria sordida TaxID=392033 RepID=A0A815KG41_9BILA|nr:unnamed protein product [Rotaria sordida]CAF4065362.1 unnamed protein product [Rotaria sordida]
MKQDYVICDSCKSLISYKAQTGTGGMQKHIECCRKISNVLDEHNESKITKYFHSAKNKLNYVPLKLKNKITNSLVEFIILDGRPFEIVNGPGFINLIECVLGVGRTLLESSTVSASDLIADPTTLSRHIDRIYDERKCQLISLFQTIKSFVITVDFWKEYFTGVHYAGISFHHVNTQFKLNTFILCCRAYELENQTSPNIRRFVNSILDEFGLSFDTSSSYVVSDNENKMRCAFADLKRVVIEKLSDEQRPTIHLVVPLRQCLINCCVVHDDDEGGLISIKKFIDDQIKTMWIPQDEHLLATILHPQLKHFDKNPSDKSRAMQVLQKEIHKRTTANQSSSSFDSSSTSITMSALTSSSEKKTTEIRKKNLLSLCFDDPRSPTSTVDEFSSWMSSTLTIDDEENDDILGFWSYHNQSFPIISTIVRDIFAIPASNTTVERLFSISKYTITDKRTRLGMEKINKLMFLRKNLNILKAIFDNQMGDKEQNQEKRKNDQSSNKSSDENSKKQKVDENDDILIEEKENMF